MLYDLWNAHEKGSSLGNKIVGYFFLSISVLGGIFLLFQGLLPFLGYLKSGVVAFSVLALIGILLIFTARKKHHASPSDLSQQALSLFKGLDVEKVLKDHAFSLPLLSFGAGVVLSQVNNPKKLLEVYKTLMK